VRINACFKLPVEKQQNIGRNISRPRELAFRAGVVLLRFSFQPFQECLLETAEFYVRRIPEIQKRKALYQHSNRTYDV
jgi:hypothetical protein